ncbi:cation diffusion facilitator family transporter [Dyadobacter sediminis]|uniref:Cation diffusion facilitator family transporter n=1 Tax=Dyadobacter sediminis TaxID=1493691 RepID=A0A5R9KHX6_9BACT|nr:cation diffusion facilitator family transporter [Dyadobacter sediminis]TLU95805.1 cation diffusion facilitator family transporter [Dyadobacter sediminis]GGB76692.1 cytochrome c551 [Dyadobacter sediminis]
MNPRLKRIHERKLIKLSIATGSVLTIWAIVVGILGDSKSIIFDALFSMVGISLSGVSLLVNNFIRKPDDDNLPFGRSQFEPFVITVQSSVIIFLCLYSLATSVMDIMNGGKAVELGIALPYLIFSIIGCFVLWLYFRKKALQLNSEYVRIESTEWQLDALLSFGVLLVLSLGYFLKNTSYAYLIPYLDPSMVLFISVLFLRIPARTFIKNIRELLQFAPDDEVEEKIHEQAAFISRKYHFKDEYVRVAKTGSSYTIEIDFLLPKEQAETQVKELDRIRQELYDLIKGDYKMWLTISFTTELKWMI